MKLLRSFLFVLCFPAFLLSSTPIFAQEISDFYSQQDGHALSIPRDETGKFDPWELFKAEKLMTNGFQSILDFLELIECDSFLQSLDNDEFLKLLEYFKGCVEFTAKYSKEDKQDELRQALQDLEAIMNGDGQFDDDIGFVALYKHDQNIVTCGWLSKQWKKAKNWMKENKGPLIIGAVVVGALVVGAVTGGVGASSAVAVGGALLGGPMDNPHPSDHINKPGEVLVQTYDMPSLPPSSTQEQETLQVQAQKQTIPSAITFNEPLKEGLSEQTIEQILEVNKIIAQAIESFDNATETQNPQSQNIISSWGSSVCHSVINGVAGFVDTVFYDENAPLEDYLDFIRSVDAWHDSTDSFFSSDSSYKESQKYELKSGVILPPVPGANVVARVGSAVTGSAIVGSAITSSVVLQEANVMVYRAFNETTGEVSYVGITNNFGRRSAEQLVERGIEIEEIDNLTNLTRNDARFVEQTLIEHHELEKNGGTLINKINSIAETNPKYAESLTRGREILIEAGYPGIE